MLSDDGEYPSGEMTITSLGSGSIFDVWARAMEEYLPDHIDGDTNVVVENTAGGGQEAATEIYNEDAGGYNFGTMNIPGNFQAEMLFDANYKIEEMTWLARSAVFPYYLFVNPDSEYDSVDDLVNADEEVSFAFVSPDASDALITVLFCEEYDIDAEYVMGYDDGREATTALERGDVDAKIQNGPVEAERIQGGDIEPILLFHEEQQDYAPEVPTVVDDGNEHLTDFSLQIFFGAPPGVDEERAEILRDSIWDTLNSEEIEEWADEAGPPGLAHDPADVEESMEIIDSQAEQISENSDLLESELT